ncbi:metal-sensing transcriptional repressor [Porcincola intestinalis]|uniref:metal-sensing transcriptional repressor n=1 Tax=Porcincola intestinalis TaxID=2606632 RepID=UPI002F422340
MSEESLNITPHNHSNGEVHTHSHASGTPDTASRHAHEHSHSHTHSPAEMRKIVNRLSRSIGHLEAVKRMIENGQDCSDVLIQLAAVKAEINNAGKALLKEHLEHCIVEAVEEQDKESIEKVNKAIDQFIR